jgi:hypothetical protein
MDYFIGQVGIDPDKFWKHTWKENHLLGEAHYISHNKEWERIRYLAAMVYNVNAQKRSQMIDPEKLFSLPQDIYSKMEKNRPKSTKDKYNSFLDKVKSATFDKKLKM